MQNCLDARIKKWHIYLLSSRLFDCHQKIWSGGIIYIIWHKHSHTYKSNREERECEEKVSEAFAIYAIIVLIEGPVMPRAR